MKDRSRPTLAELQGDPIKPKPERTPRICRYCQEAFTPKVKAHPKRGHCYKPACEDRHYRAVLDALLLRRKPSRAT